MDQSRKLTIIQIYASKGWGGGERYVFDLSQSLVADGHRVISISKKCLILETKIKLVGCCYQLPMRGVCDLCSGVKLARIIRSEKPDIIHVHNFKDAFVAVYAKKISGIDVKIVLSRHLVKRSKSNVLYNWLYDNIDKFIFVSHLAEEEFLKSKICVGKDKIAVIHNSIKVTEVDVEGNIHERYDIPLSSVILAFSGRVVSEKGLEVLFDALGELRSYDFKLLVLGRGGVEYVEELERKALELGIADKIIMVGFVDDVRSIISQVDIGVIPSIVRESFGLSVIEFMSLGKVVVTTNNGAQPEFIEDGVNGYLVPPSDVKALADKLQMLFECGDVRDVVGRCAEIDFVKTLSYDKFYENMKSLYGSLIIS